MLLQIKGKSASYAQVKRLYPNEAFPSRPNEETMRAKGHHVEPTPRPLGDVVTQGDPRQDEDGTWRQTWNVRDYTPEDREQQFENARQATIEEINAAYSAEVEPLTRDYPEIEQKTWLSQEAEARAYLEWHNADAQGAPPATPVLDNILAGRNGDDGSETLEQLSRAVLENAELFTQAQQLTGRRQRLVKQARAAESEDALAEIHW